jgi:hypothetical protein
MIAIELLRSTMTALEGGADMFDSFSEGTVFYGRTVAVVVAMMAAAVLVHFI